MGRHKSLTPKQILAERADIEARIKAYVMEQNRKNKSFRFFTASAVVRKLKLPANFLKEHVICMSCGHTEDKSTYAIAQLALGNKVFFTCKCGHKTFLTQH